MEEIWYSQFSACFGGREIIKRKNLHSKPEHLRVVIITSAVWLFLCLYSQPESPESLTWFIRESSPWGFLFLHFIQGWIGRKSLSPSLCKPSKLAAGAATSLLFCLGLQQMELFKSCVFSSASLMLGNTAFFYCLVFILKPILMNQLSSQLCCVNSGGLCKGLPLRALGLASGLAVLLPEECKM